MTEQITITIDDETCINAVSQTIGITVEDLITCYLNAITRVREAYGTDNWHANDDWHWHKALKNQVVDMLHGTLNFMPEDVEKWHGNLWAFIHAVTVTIITNEPTVEPEIRLELSHAQCVWVIMIITDFTNYHHIMHDAEVLRTLFNDDDEGSYCIDQLSQQFFGRLLDVVQADALAKAVYDEAMTVAIETK